MSTSNVEARGGLVTRPALKVLQEDQRSLLNRDAGEGSEPALRQGFQSRRELIEWYQRAIVRTFGEVAEVWDPSSLASDLTLVSACIVDEERRRWYVDDPMSISEAKGYRILLENHAVLPASNRAYRELRKVAGEYGDDGDDDPNLVSEPSQQEWVAMRPGFAQKDAEQRGALRTLWGGFTDLHELDDWLHTLNEPTYGAIPDDFPGRVLRDQVAIEHLIEDGLRSLDDRVYRDWFAINFLLPAFVEGIRDMDSVELASKQREDNPWNEV